MKNSGINAANDYTSPYKIIEVLTTFWEGTIGFINSSNFADLITFLGIFLLILNLFFPNKIKDINIKIAVATKANSTSRKKLFVSSLFAFIVFVFLILVTSFCIYLFVFNWEQMNDSNRSWFSKIFDYSFGFICTLVSAIYVLIQTIKFWLVFVIDLVHFLGNRRAITGFALLVAILGQAIKYLT
jgi:hypothetical protein